jgi:hypothetical protein
LDCVNKYIAGRTQRQWYQDNKERLIEKAKKYHERNRDILNAKNKERYYKNREQISESGKEKIRCECGQDISRAHLTRHKQTNRHQKLLEDKNLV